MSDPTIRFGVGSPTEAQSVVWRLWVHGSDVYLMPRAARRWKISLHASGRCHWGFESKQDLLASADEKAARSAMGRFADSWTVAGDFGGGWRRAFTIIVPTSELCVPKRARKLTQVLWVHPVADGGAVSFAVLFGPHAATPESVPLVRDHPSQWLFGQPLADGLGSVWLVAYAESVIPESAIQQLEHSRKALSTPHRQERLDTLPDPAGFAFGTVNDDGSRFYLEIKPQTG